MSRTSRYRHGWLLTISERPVDLHLRSCEASAPDPVTLAKRLARLELTCEFDGFYRSAATYAEVLGQTGLAAFRQEIEPEWRQIDQQDDGRSTEAYRLREAMIGWALGMGDPDALVEAHRSDRINPANMLEIAVMFEGAERDDEAIEWARRGLVDLGHGSWGADGLRDFLARKLRERDDDGAALDLYWKSFEARPSLTGYRTLKQQDGDTDWLSRCQQHMLTRLGAGTSTASLPPDVMSDYAPAAPAGASILTEILLFEGRVADAWDAALEHGTSQQTWMTLAREREKSAPRDSIAIYASAAVAIISRKKANQYEAAVDLMSRIRRLASDAGEPQRFDSLLQRVRTEHKAKRRLKALLDGMGW